MKVRSTPDVFIGLDNPTMEDWDAWHRAMLAERSAMALANASANANAIASNAYADPSTDWADTSFRQLFLFMYDASFYDRSTRRYRARELIDRAKAMFGRIDSVLLWHAYPRLGFDSRKQFDFYTDMPGGIDALRAEVTNTFHEHGIRVFVDYNPWAEGTYEELGDIVARLNADGVMLDTMTDAPNVLERAVLAQSKRGIVFAPELRLRDIDLGRHRQSWAQWSDLGDAQTPSIYRPRWLLPKHRQLSIRRWDTSRRDEIIYSFFCGSGLILWDNIFGTHNPYSREDRRLIAETGAILDHYQDVFVNGQWLPLIPTGVSGLDANKWVLRDRAIITLRNRSSEPVRYRIPDSEVAYGAFWGDNQHELHGNDEIVIAPHGVEALVLDTADARALALAHFVSLSKRADDTALPDLDTRRHAPLRQLEEPQKKTANKHQSSTAMIKLQKTNDFEMHIRHERRECGCYPFGATDDAMWGWFYKDIVEHRIKGSIGRFAIRKTAVTNADYIAFVHASSYAPKDPEAFLRHIARRDDGALPLRLPDELAALPVTWVSLADARVFAEWHGERLPSEAEWQWAAEGAGAGNVYPWGNEERAFAPQLTSAHNESTSTPQGVMGLSGNAWELTESEYSDGHTRFVMLRGGVFLPVGESEWLPARGARPNNSHAKYLLLSDGLDRSDTISFRTVIDVEDE